MDRDLVGDILWRGCFGVFEGFSPRCDILAPR